MSPIDWNNDYVIYIQNKKIFIINGRITVFEKPMYHISFNEQFKLRSMHIRYNENGKSVNKIISVGNVASYVYYINNNKGFVFQTNSLLTTITICLSIDTIIKYTHEKPDLIIYAMYQRNKPIYGPFKFKLKPEFHNMDNKIFLDSKFLIEI